MFNAGGVGLFLKPNENKELVIHRLAVGGSADRSGQIHPGDIVVAVDDNDVYKKEFSVCVKLIQGEVGTSVKITVWKQGNPNNPKQVWLTRTLNPEDDQSSGSNRSRSRTADIGIEFKADETGCFQISGLKPDGPAEKSGQVDVGDILYEIDGVKVLYGIGPNGRPLSNIEISEMLRGPEDSVLNLRLQKGRMGRLSQAYLTRKVPPYGVRSPQYTDSRREREKDEYPTQPQPPPAQPSFSLQPPPPPPDYPPSRSDAPRSPPRTPLYPPSTAPPVQQVPATPSWQQQQLLPVQPPNFVAEPQLRPQLRPRPVPRPEPPLPPPPPAITHVAERPLPDDLPDVLAKYPDGYWKEYRPRRPDRFGLGIVFKPFGNGQVRVNQILKGGPADLSGQDIEENDWVYEIDRELVYKQSLSKIMRMLHGKKKGQPVFLGLRRGGREDLFEVKIVKGDTKVPSNDCGVGIVFKSDPIVGGWVRVAQVIPGGPADEAVKPLKGSEVIKINDRILEVNGVDVTRQQFESWQHLLRGTEGSSCVITFADVHAELYTVHIRRNEVTQEEVDPSCVTIPPPIFEAPIKAQPKALVPDKKVIAHIAPVTCGISFMQKENEEVVVDHVAIGGPADKLAKFIPESRGKSIAPGDILMEVDGKDVYKKPVEDWKELITQGRPGSEIRFKFKVPNENVTYDVLVKRALVRKPDLSIGVSFRAGPDGTFEVSSVNPTGPAAGKGIEVGDKLLEISKQRLVNGRCDNGTDQDMYKVTKANFHEWKGVISEGEKEKTVVLKLQKPGQAQPFVVSVPRKPVLFNVAIQWAALGSNIFVDKVFPITDTIPSSAQIEGIREGYVLQAIQNVPMVGNLDTLQLTMNELLLGEYGSKVILTFKTADGDFTFGVARDIDTKVADTDEKPFRPSERVPNLGSGFVRPFQPTELVPGGGVFKQPMSNPELWSSFLDEGRPIVDAEGRPQENKSHLFTWRGRILSQPEYSLDHSVCKVFDVGGLENEDSSRYELIYYGPGMREPRVPLLPGQYAESSLKQTPLPTHQTVQIPKAPEKSVIDLEKEKQRIQDKIDKEEAEKKKEADNKAREAKLKEEAAKKKEVPPPPPPPVGNNKVTPPPPPPEPSSPPANNKTGLVQQPPPPPPANDRLPPSPRAAAKASASQPQPPPPPPEEAEDDESILILNDGSKVEAKNIEKARILEFARMLV